jgi:hypothetical protein
MITLVTSKEGKHMRSARNRGLALVSALMLVLTAAVPVPAGADVVVRTASSALPSAVAGDFNGDGRTDILLTGASGWTGMPVALRNTSGGFTVSHQLSPGFAAKASLPEVKIITGRFDSNNTDDIVLTGVPGWSTLSLARSNGNGTFAVTNVVAGQFAAWAGAPGAQVHSGDFNGDGRTDLALTGGDTWNTIPVAFSNGDGTFTVTNNSVPAFAAAAQHDESRIFAGDLNADGRTDLTLLPGGDALLTELSLSMAYSTGNGTFQQAETWMPDFVGSADHETVIPGDFNADNKADLAIVLDDRILVAYSRGTGFVELYRAGATPNFYLRANRPGARLIGTDNSCDGKTDLVVLPEPGSTWTTVPVAMQSDPETFYVMDDALPNFTGWSKAAGAQLVYGDYDADDCEDLALAGGSGWSTIPLAMSNGDGSYHEQNPASPQFAAWSAGASPVTLPPAPAETVGILSLLDTGVWSGITSSTAIGSDGLGVISYYVSSGGLLNLRVGHCEDIACTTITTTDIDTVGDVGRFSSIKIGSDGLPLISYIAERNADLSAFTNDLKVAHCHNVACTSATITTLDAPARVSDLTSLTIGGDGYGLISYQDTTSSSSTKMKVAHCLNIACTSATLSTIASVKPDNGETGGYSQTGIATGNHGLGLISFYDGGSNQMLKVAACTNADCSTSIVTMVDRAPNPTASLHGGWSSVAFGHDGLALISYNGNYSSAAGGANLRIAKCLNVYCTASTTITADTGGYTGVRSSIAIGGDGLGVVSYHDLSNRDLKVAHCANLACSSVTSTVVDGFDDVGSRSAITTGTDGLPLISYQGPGFLGVILRVVRCGNADCTAVIVAPF